jgi:glycosyltransferase involved in cell wall biosynthesis
VNEGRTASVVFVGTYPPRLCGIASFTSDLRQAIAQTPARPLCSVVAIDPPNGRYDYPTEVTQVVRQDVREDYLDVAQRINASDVDIVCLQHEFGIFGGPAGAHVLALAEALAAPLVVTLHTVLAKPSDRGQLEVMSRLADRTAKFVVMSERGRELLVRSWGLSPARIAVVPHGGPAPPACDPAADLRKRERILTFGLLGPDKGVETVIRALPMILQARPEASYLVAGATHPNLVAQEGERYRESLASLASSLGMSAHVAFQNAYVGKAELLRTIVDSDLCVLPYLKEAHITSGTLAYAAALSRPVIATPFWHAQDLLDDGAGVITPFADPEALAEAVIALLADPGARESLGRRLGARVAAASWPSVGQRYVQLFREAAPGWGASPRARSSRGVSGDGAATALTPSLAGLLRMTDDTGLLQHSRFNVPDRRHGYCLDDNARALLLLNRFPGPVDEARARLARTFAAFVESAWDEDAACVRNFMGYDRRWLEPRGSDDSFGRAIWALAATAVGPFQDLQAWARDLLDRMLGPMAQIAWPRSDAFTILGLSELCARDAGSTALREVLATKAARLAARLEGVDGDWRWFEVSLSYDNARLPEALIRAGEALGHPMLIADGITTLAWLCARQTSPEGLFRPVANLDFGRPRALDHVFDQQPLEAAATADACLAALEAGGGDGWAHEAERALAWFEGANDLGVTLLPPGGGGECCDGLQRGGLNRNQGAESILAFQFALCSVQRIRSRLSSSTAPLDRRRNRRGEDGVATY